MIESTAEVMPNLVLIFVRDLLEIQLYFWTKTIRIV